MTSEQYDAIRTLNLWELNQELGEVNRKLWEENKMLRNRVFRLRNVAIAAATDLAESHETRAIVGEEFAEEQWMRCERTDAAVERLDHDDLGLLPPPVQL